MKEMPIVIFVGVVAAVIATVAIIHLLQVSRSAKRLSARLREEFGLAVRKGLGHFGLAGPVEGFNVLVGFEKFVERRTTRDGTTNVTIWKGSVSIGRVPNWPENSGVYRRKKGGPFTGDGAFDRAYKVEGDRLFLQAFMDDAARSALQQESRYDLALGHLRYYGKHAAVTPAFVRTGLTMMKTLAQPLPSYRSEDRSALEATLAAPESAVSEQARAFLALVKLAPDEAAAFASIGLGSPHKAFRITMLEYVAEHQLDCLSQLAEMTAVDDPYEAVALMAVLEVCADTSCEDALVNLLGISEDNVQEKAADKLGYVGTLRAVPRLRKLAGQWVESDVVKAAAHVAASLIVDREGSDQAGGGLALHEPNEAEGGLAVAGSLGELSESD